MRRLGPLGAPPQGEASLGLAAPAWSYHPHRFPNGSAVLSLALAIASGVFLSAPGAILVVPGAILAVPAVALAVRGLRRQRAMPWLRGRRAARAALVVLGVGVLLASWSTLSIVR